MKFDAAMRILLREELKYIDPPASLHAAIRVLEAAANVPANSEKHLRYHHTTENEDGSTSYGCYICNTIIALLESLPDDTDAKEKE